MQANVTPADTRAIVKYLSDHNGLAPEEARPIAFEFERRLVEWSYDGDKDVATLCGGCHAFSRVMSERTHIRARKHTHTTRTQAHARH